MLRVPEHGFCIPHCPCSPGQKAPPKLNLSHSSLPICISSASSRPAHDSYHEPHGTLLSFSPTLFKGISIQPSMNFCLLNCLIPNLQVAWDTSYSCIIVIYIMELNFITIESREATGDRKAEKDEGCKAIRVNLERDT